MVQDDNDNFTLAHNAIRWLSEGPNGRRRHVLVVHQGAVLTKLDLPLAYPWPDHIPLRLINRLIRIVEEERIVPDALQRTFGRDQLLLGFWLGATVLFVFRPM